MKKVTNSRIFFSAMLALGFVAIVSLSACTGSGENQESEKTEEASKETDGTSETEAAIDTTGHDHHNHAEGEEHPAGGDEHPN